MLKKILLAAALASPSLAFADMSIVVQLGTRAHAGHVDYRPVYSYHHGEQYRMTRAVNAQQENQRDRIAQGVRSGELTRQEAERLQREQWQIRVLEQRYLSDRRLSQHEYAKLQEELREAGQHIRAEKSDRQDRDKQLYVRR
jgi:hypothetical protein